METQEEGKLTQETPQDAKKLAKVGLPLPVPGYPYPLEITVALTPELELELHKELDERRRNQMMSNIILNMLTASMMSMAEPKNESGLILPK